MSEPTKLNPENADVVRKLVVPVETSVESKNGDRSPTKTERDGSIKTESQTDAAKPIETVRELVVPNQSTEFKDDDRSPTKTERDGSVKPEPEADSAKPVEVIRNLVVPTQSTEIKDDDRTPTKTERGVDI